MPAGGRVTLSLIRHGGNIHLNVKDAGLGIPTEVIARVFDAFFTTRKMGEGTGLGLTVSREIVHEHGGELIIASVEGEGTTAVVTLPAVSTRAGILEEATAAA